MRDAGAGGLRGQDRSQGVARVERFRAAIGNVFRDSRVSTRSFFSASARIARRLAALSVALSAGLIGCSGQQTLPYGELPYYPPAIAASAGPQLIGVGDQLRIKFLYHVDLDTTANVPGDGKIGIPGLGDFQAAGLTTEELEESVYRRASLTHRDPEVSVNVAARAEQFAYVGGEVRRPGYVPLRPGMTALRAIFERGGYMDTAKVDNVLVVKIEPNGHYEARIVNLKTVLETGDVRGDAVLTANDFVFIPKTAVANADLWVRQYIRDLIPVREPTTRFDTIGQ